MADPNPTRRAALKAAAALPLLAGAARPPKPLAVGVLGCGARGREIAAELAALGVRVSAICDVAQFRLDSWPKELADPGLYRCRTAKQFFEREPLDAVVIATPDHHHRDHLLTALACEKDVYLEAPVSASLSENKDILSARQQSSRVVQVGFPWRSAAHWESAVRAAQGRRFGKLVQATAVESRNWQSADPTAGLGGVKPDLTAADWEQFLGAAPKRAFDPRRYWGWRYYWDTGAGLMPELAQPLLDLVQWAGQLDAPKSANVTGGRYHFDAWDTPDVLDASFDYGKLLASFGANAVSRSRGSELRLIGTRQTLVATERDICLYDTADALDAAQKPVERWLVAPSLRPHLQNWLDCIQSREEPTAPLSLGLKAATAAHLGTLAYRTGQRQFWDADRLQVIGGR